MIGINEGKRSCVIYGLATILPRRPIETISKLVCCSRCARKSPLCGSPNGCPSLIEREQKYHLRQSVQPAQMYDSRCRSVCDITSSSPSMNQTENTSCNPYKEHLKDISKRSPTGVLLTTPRGDSGLRHKSGVYGLNGQRAYFIISLFKGTYRPGVQVSRNFHALFTNALENSDTCD